MGVALRLKEWRARRGYSVRSLAERAGVGFVTVSRIENERMSPTVAMLEKLAAGLAIEVRDFFPEPPKARTRRRGVRRRKA